MRAITYIKDYVAKHSYKENKPNRIKGSLYSNTEGCLAEFIEEDSESESQSSFSHDMDNKNAPLWRPGSQDDIPYG